MMWPARLKRDPEAEKLVDFVWTELNHHCAMARVDRYQTFLGQDGKRLPHRETTGAKPLS